MTITGIHVCLEIIKSNVIFEYSFKCVTIINAIPVFIGIASNNAVIAVILQADQPIPTM